MTEQEYAVRLPRREASYQMNPNLAVKIPIYGNPANITYYAQPVIALDID